MSKDEMLPASDGTMGTAYEAIGRGAQAPLDYPLGDVGELLFVSPPCETWHIDRSAGTRRRAWLLEHGTWWQRVKAQFGFTS